MCNQVTGKSRKEKRWKHIWKRRDEMTVGDKKDEEEEKRQT